MAEKTLVNNTSDNVALKPSRDLKLAQELLTHADVEINGNRPWDIQIHHPGTIQRIFRDGSLGLGEAYMDGWWSCAAVDVFICKILSARLHQKVRNNLQLAARTLISLILNRQSIKRSTRVAKVHYNLDNDLYHYMLGDVMSYTCAYWKDASTLTEAQNNKHDLICRKLQLKPGDKVLELGCGWGSFAKHAAQHYGCEMVSVNISDEQVKYAKESCKDLPVSVHLCDYRDTKTYNPNKIKFDKVVSIGMCEHVGYKNYRTFLNIAFENVKEHGLFLLHTIGGNRFTTQCEPWTDKYIFPGGVCPSIRGLGKAMENGFVMEDWHNFGAYYDPTLMAWHKNFINNWEHLKDRYDERFYRMWTYYLLSCAGMFRARQAGLWQIVLSKYGVPNGYESVR